MARHITAGLFNSLGVEGRCSRDSLQQACMMEYNTPQHDCLSGQAFQRQPAAMETGHTARSSTAGLSGCGGQALPGQPVAGVTEHMACHITAGLFNSLGVAGRGSRDSLQSACMMEYSMSQLFGCAGVPEAACSLRGRAYSTDQYSRTVCVWRTVAAPAA